MSGSSHPALFWLGFAYAQRVTERGRSRGGGGGFRNVSFLHLQRTRQGREVGRPHGGRDGFRRGTKRSDAPTRGPLKLKPRRKGFLPFKLREALRKPRRLPAFNFGRRRLLRGRDRPVTFAPTPPAARRPGPRGPQDPAGGLPPRRPPPAQASHAGPQAAAATTCPGAGPPAVRCSGSDRPFKWKPLSPSPRLPRSACGRTAPPCPAPHRNESGRAARSAPPRGAVCARPSRPFGLQRLPRLMV